MFRILHPVLIIALIFSSVSSNHVFSSPKDAKAFVSAQLNQPVGQGLGFNLMNVGNTGLQKTINLENITTNYSMLFDLSSHYTIFIDQTAHTNFIPVSNYSWGPNTYPNPSNSPDNNVAVLFSGNLSGYRQELNITIPGMGEFSAGTYNSTDYQSGNLINYTSFMAQNIPSSIQNILAYADADGILGLGLNNGTCRFLEGLYNSSLISTQSFSFFMTMDPNGYDVLSEIIFEDFDTRYANTSFNTYPVPDNNSWSITLDSVSLNGTTITTQSSNAYFSSIVNGIGIPSSLYNNFESFTQPSGYTCQLSGDNIYCQCPQGQLSSLPTLDFVIGGQTYSVPPVYYANYQPTLQWDSLPGSVQEVTLDERIMKRESEIQKAIERMKNYDYILEEIELGEDTTTTTTTTTTTDTTTTDTSSSDTSSSWDSDDSSYTDWSDSTYTYNYDPYWNYGFMYYNPYFYGWGYGGLYPFYGYGYPIIIYNYDYYSNPSNPNVVPNAGDVCQLNLVNAGNYALNNTDSEAWLLGIPFLQAFYTVFSAGDNITVSLATANQPFHFWVNTDVKPAPKPSNHTWIWIVVGIVGFCLLAAFMYNCMKNCNNSNNSNNNYNDNGERRHKKKKNKKHHHHEVEKDTIIVTSQAYNPPMQNYQPQFNNNFGQNNLYQQPFQQPYQQNFQQPYQGYQPNAYQQQQQFGSTNNYGGF